MKKSENHVALTAHTPGPWRAIDHVDACGLGGPVTERGQFYWIEFIPGKTALSGLISQDDANLVIAAPDMLAALRRIAKPHDCGCSPCHGQCRSQEALQIYIDAFRDVASAAIAKATGAS